MRKIIKAVKLLECGCGNKISPGMLYQVRMGRRVQIGSFRCLTCFIEYPAHWFIGRVRMTYDQALKEFREMQNDDHVSKNKEVKL